MLNSYASTTQPKLNPLFNEDANTVSASVAHQKRHTNVDINYRLVNEMWNKITNWATAVSKSSADFSESETIKITEMFPCAAEEQSTHLHV